MLCDLCLNFDLKLPYAGCMAHQAFCKPDNQFVSFFFCCKGYRKV